MYPLQMLNAHFKKFTECNFWTEMSTWYLFKNVTLFTEMFTNFLQTIQNKNMTTNGPNIIMGQTFKHLLNLRMKEKLMNP